MDRAKRIYTVLFISVFATMLGLGIISPLLPIYAEDLGATGIWLGVVFSAFALSRSVFMPIVGRLSDQRGRKQILLIGLLAYSVVSLGYIVAGNVYALTGVRFVHGLASAMVVPIAMAYIGDLSEKGKEGSHMGNFSISLFLGMGAGPLLGGLLNDTFGLASVFYMMAGLSAFACILVGSSLPAAAGRPIPAGGELPSFRDVLSLGSMRGVVIFTMINAVGRGSTMVFIPIFAPLIALSPFEVGVLLSSNIFLMALLQVPVGWFTDRGHKIALILAGSLITSVSLILIPLTHSFWPLLAVTSLLGVGSAVQQPSIMALTVESGKLLGMGTAMAAYNTVMGIGMIIAPLAGGLFLDVLGIEAVFYAGGLTCIAATFVFSFAMRKARQRSAEAASNVD
ncbi:MAG: MFS transporter [Methanomicrobiaceae archaeon]|nr:MFS transporter [Methanomicrobiaceae archaeon]